MRARTLVIAALLGASLMFTGEAGPAAEAAATKCEPKEIGAQSGTMCRQYSLFGIRFSPKVIRIKVTVPKGTDSNIFPAGTTIALFWRNGDQYDHQIQTVSARDTLGNLMGFRDTNGVMDCTGLVACADWTSIPLPPRGPLLAGQRVRDEGTNTDKYSPPRPGTYTFRCLIHPSMNQTIVIQQAPKFR
jgi:plastocyanin